MNQIVIAVIGAGQLGCRYLQSILKSFENSRVYVVDPFPSSLEKARSMISGTPGIVESNVVVYVSSLTEVPNHLDLAVVATTADVRLSVLEELTFGRKIEKLVLEKVLFQSVSDLMLAEKLLSTAGIPAWVNCGRRVYDLYSHVREYLASDTIYQVDLFGGEWGLGCNSIHFLDIVAFLTNSPLLSVSLIGVPPEWIPAKRPGFFEFFGTLEALYENGTAVRLVSRRGSHADHTIQISGETKTVFIDEPHSQYCFRKSDGLWELREERIPYLSEYMGPLLRGLVLEGRCGLTPFSESSELHYPFLSALANHFSVSKVPIT